MHSLVHLHRSRNHRRFHPIVGPRFAPSFYCQRFHHKRPTARNGLTFLRHRQYTSRPFPAKILSLPNHAVPQVTIIRPCKGLEPYLYDCLSSTFRQDYPFNKLTVHFCVSSRDDPAFPIIQRVLQDHPGSQGKVFVEDEDPLLITNGDGHGEAERRNGTAHKDARERLGPNPKIRNMSRAYREAGKDDLIWILDCNIWVGRGTCARMVDKLSGLDDGQGEGKGYKFVHHVPVSIAVDGQPDAFPTDPPPPPPEQSHARPNGLVKTEAHHQTAPESVVPWYSPSTLGSRLEETFLSSAHAKMYIAINSLSIAPCINGKSNMFRRAHLDHLTSSPALPARAKGSAASRRDDVDDAGYPEQQQKQHPIQDATMRGAELKGIDAFSRYICEDHLIGELFWGHPIPGAERMRNHGLVFGDLALQPLARMGVGAYVARRVRWLRVRKFTVTLATLVEPGTECGVCSAIGGFGAAMVMTGAGGGGSVFGAGWWACFVSFWVVSVVVWAGVDRSVYCLLHSGATIETNDGADGVPDFVASMPPLRQHHRRNEGRERRGHVRPFHEWLLAWVGREMLALPIWTWAFWGGTTVVWRNGVFRVGMDMRVHEIRGKDKDKDKGD